MAGGPSFLFLSPVTGNPCASRSPPLRSNLKRLKQTKAGWKENGGVG